MGENRRWMSEQTAARLLRPPAPRLKDGTAEAEEEEESAVEAEAWLGAAAVMAQFEGG